MVRGWASTCVAVAVAFAACSAAFAQSASPAPPASPVPPGRALEKFPLSTDELFSPGTAVPSRVSNQPNRQPPGVPEEPDYTLPPGSIIPLPQGKSSVYKYTRRYGTPNNIEIQDLPDGFRRFVFTGGIILNAIDNEGQETELATDDAVVWTRNVKNETPDGFQAETGKSEVEVYLSGRVVLRQKPKTGSVQTIRADELYYDRQRERAIAVRASMEFIPEKFIDPVRLRGEEIRRLDEENWEVLTASFDGSKLPSDPGLRFDATRATLREHEVQLRNAFGIPYRDLLTGEKLRGTEKMMTAYNAVPKLAGVPIFYLPRMRTDIGNPMGPFIGVSFGQGRIFGTQVHTTWDLFDLLALKPPPGQSLRLHADYLSARGPGLGTDYNYRVSPPPDTGLAGAAGLLKMYGIEDHGTDVVGSGRGPQPTPPTFRGRVTFRHQQELLEGLYFQGGVAYLSDKNFFEQYYKQEFEWGPNQETFAHLKWQQDNYGAAALTEYRLNRPWVAETQWLPRLDGFLVGQSFLDDLFVYSTHASAGYALARPSTINPGPVLPTDVKVDTGRFDLMQELSVPFALGPVKVAPYGTVDLTGYTADVNGNSAGRVWGGAGSRATLPMTRVYEGVESELFNLRGLNHKIVFGGNYLYARTNVPFTQLPLLDRLNDDATDQSWRNITPMQTNFVTGPNGVLLATGGMPTSQYNPQRYLIRRAYTGATDTLDNIDVFQMDIRQRFQTKRGYPGLEHTVDVLTVAASASYFPELARDNFGHPFGFLEYDALWNVGDRVSLLSSGWFEPYQNGSRYFTVGATLSRPDRTNFYVGYRQTDPLNSRAMSASVAYQLSPKYTMNLSSSYDFGISQALSNSFYLTRVGTDLTVTIGLSYNTLVNNLNVQFMITPNLLTAMMPARFTGGPVGRSR